MFVSGYVASSGFGLKPAAPLCSPLSFSGRPTTGSAVYPSGSVVPRSPPPLFSPRRLCTPPAPSSTRSSRGPGRARRRTGAGPPRGRRAQREACARDRAASNFFSGQSPCHSSSISGTPLRPTLLARGRRTARTDLPSRTHPSITPPARERLGGRALRALAWTQSTL